jgi:hypothetical protein
MTMKTLGTEGVLKAYCDKHLPVSSPEHSSDLELTGLGGHEACIGLRV